MGRNLNTSPIEVLVDPREEHKRRAPFNGATPSVILFLSLKLPGFNWKRDESRPKLSRYVDARYIFYIKK